MAENMSKSMNVFLWVLQVLFGLYYITGGLYMMSNYKILASSWALNALPVAFWIILSVVEILFALGLVLPGMFLTHRLTAISAGGLAVISLFGSVLYVAYSGLGVLWAVIPAVVLAFVAYERY